MILRRFVIELALLTTASIILWPSLVDSERCRMYNRKPCGVVTKWFDTLFADVINKSQGFHSRPLYQGLYIGPSHLLLPPTGNLRPQDIMVHTGKGRYFEVRSLDVYPGDYTIVEFKGKLDYKTNHTCVKDARLYKPDKLERCILYKNEPQYQHYWDVTLTNCIDNHPSDDVCWRGVTEPVSCRRNAGAMVLCRSQIYGTWKVAGVVKKCNRGYDDRELTAIRSPAAASSTRDDPTLVSVSAAYLNLDGSKQCNTLKAGSNKRPAWHEKEDPYELLDSKKAPNLPEKPDSPKKPASPKKPERPPGWDDDHDHEDELERES